MDTGQLNSLFGISHNIDQFGIMKAYDKSGRKGKKMAKATTKTPKKQTMTPKKGGKKGC